jgi:hypothetical protein
VFGPFSAGDSLRVYRLQRKGLTLDLQRSLTQPFKPLWEAWLAFLTQHAMGQPTYVWVDLREGEGFVQVRYRPHQAAADVAYLSPTLQAGNHAANAWSQLLDGACVEAASRGIQRVFASLPDSSAETELFQQSGFALYAGEDIYQLASDSVDKGRVEPQVPRPQAPEDWPAIQKLCVAITPQRVRQAEGGITAASGVEKNCRRYVLPGDRGEDLAAVLNVYVGAHAYWLRLLVHPNARDVTDGLIQWVLASLADQPPSQVYCSVRQYEGGVRAALEAAGFEHLSTRALMVKHTLAWSKLPVLELAPALSGSAEVAPPAYRIESDSEVQVQAGRLAANQKS